MVKSLFSVLHSIVIRRSIFARSLSNIKHCDLTVIKSEKKQCKPELEGLPFGKEMTDHMLQIEWEYHQGWSPPLIKHHEPLYIHPNAGVLQLGGQIYEGMKAYYGVDGKVRLFRADENMKRFSKSASRLCLPDFDGDELLQCVIDLVRLDKDWVPKKEGYSLYIRPSLISLDTTSGDTDLKKALLFVILSPVGPYFKTSKGGPVIEPVSLLANPNFVRAWPGGIGEYKVGGNYGATVSLQKEAEKIGYNQILWLLDDEITEAGTMNFIMHWINENGDEEVITPPISGLILQGITRKSFLDVARQWDEFLVSERKLTIHDLVKGVQENRVKEVFCVGTACVVCPINKIMYNDQVFDIPFPKNNMASRFYNQLMDIQYGRVPDHPWTTII